MHVKNYECEEHFMTIFKHLIRILELNCILKKYLKFFYQLSKKLFRCMCIKLIYKAIFAVFTVKKNRIVNFMTENQSVISSYFFIYVHHKKYKYQKVFIFISYVIG